MTESMYKRIFGDSPLLDNDKEYLDHIKKICDPSDCGICFYTDKMSTKVDVPTNVWLREIALRERVIA